jgi:hypothetical protein
LREPFIHALVYGRIEYPTEKTIGESNEGFMRAFEEFRNRIPALRRGLLEEFRGILGVK